MEKQKDCVVFPHFTIPSDIVNLFVSNEHIGIVIVFPEDNDNVVNS